MELRDYQEEAVDIVNRLPDGSRSIVAIATGLGKTACAAHFSFAGRMLWISHRDELVRQPAHYFKELGRSFGIEKADQTSNGEDVVSASVQSLASQKRLERFDPDAFEMIVVDEAHHASAPSYRKILSYFHPRKLIGLTATPRRGDKARLSDVFDTICFSRDLRWGINHGWLSPIRCARVYSDFSLKGVVMQQGDFSISGLDAAMDKSDNAVVVARAYMEHCLPKQRKTLIYCPSVRTGRLVAETLMRALKDAGHLDAASRIAFLEGETPPDIRARMLARYMSEDAEDPERLDCIVNCMILTEGTDLPMTSCIINDRPTANSTLYTQIVGRGTRKHPGKEYCLIIDICDKDGKGHSICTVPTLFGLEQKAVPPSIWERLGTADEDIMDDINALAEERAQMAKYAKIRQEMVDIFAADLEQIVAGHAVDGYLAVAGAYAKKVERDSEQSGHDFGDLMVKTLPYADHRYRIDATYEGRIYLSNPDMLDRVRIEIKQVAIDKNYPELSAISPLMPLESSLQFVHDVLQYAVHPRYAILWSREARQQAARVFATSRQHTALYYRYRELGVQGKTNGMTLTQAGDLFDLYGQLEAIHRDKEAAALALADSNKPRRGRAKAKWEREQEEKAAAAEAEKQNLEHAWKKVSEFLQQRVELARRINARSAKEVFEKEREDRDRERSMRNARQMELLEQARAEKVQRTNVQDAARQQPQSPPPSEKPAISVYTMFITLDETCRKVTDPTLPAGFDQYQTIAALLAAPNQAGHAMRGTLTIENMMDLRINRWTAACMAAMLKEAGILAAEVPAGQVLILDLKGFVRACQNLIAALNGQMESIGQLSIRYYQKNQN